MCWQILSGCTCLTVHSTRLILLNSVCYQTKNFICHLLHRLWRRKNKKKNFFCCMYRKAKSISNEAFMRHHQIFNSCQFTINFVNFTLAKTEAASAKIHLMCKYSGAETTCVKARMWRSLIWTFLSVLKTYVARERPRREKKRTWALDLIIHALHLTIWPVPLL